MQTSKVATIWGRNHLMGVTKTNKKNIPPLSIGTGIRKNVILDAFWPHREGPPHETLTTQMQSLMQKTTTIGDGSPSRGLKTHTNLENGNNNMTTEAPHGSNKNLKNNSHQSK